MCRIGIHIIEVDGCSLCGVEPWRLICVTVRTILIWLLHI